jgi:2'-5' RNA ligase
MRLFFALWPDAAAVAGLQPWIARAHECCGGRPTRPDTLHLTLAFLGTATAQQTDALIAFTRTQQRVAPGELALTHYGAFRRLGLVWAGPDPEAPATQALHAVYDDLWLGLAALGWPRPAQPFRPHVTLLRKATVDPLPVANAPLSWRYDRYVLVASESQTGGSRYRVLQ